MPDELPSWHIESKGTKSPVLTAGRLKAWFQQQSEDCPVQRYGVILHTADGKEPVAIMSLPVYRSVAYEAVPLSASAEESFSPTRDLAKMEKGLRIMCSISGKPIQDFKFAAAIAFEVQPGVVAIAVPAEVWLNWAKQLEAKTKDAKEKLAEELSKPKLEVVR